VTFAPAGELCARAGSSPAGAFGRSFGFGLPFDQLIWIKTRPVEVR
jgi:hypothetical protein